ncbi:MAG: hypothetical protein KDD55_11530, partial [Bdellovibrionales bacterium]|nr:hypothetical protein [Bdellovibrionales bacterium]
MKKWFPAPFLGVLFLTVFLRVLFLLLIPGEAMSLDMIRWGRVIDKLLAEPLPLNPYNTTTYLNGPPFWMQFLFVIGKVEGATGLSRFLFLR